MLNLLFLIILVVYTLTAFVIIYRKNTLIELLKSEVDKLTVIDPLTHTYNRPFFDKNYIREFHRCRRVKQPLGIVLFSIDNINSINNEFSHEIGDMVISSVANALNDVIQRDTDFVARYHGHEFIAILYNTKSDGAELVINRVKKSLDFIKIEDYPKEITLSIGVHVGIPDNHTNSNMMLSEANKALKKAKKESGLSVEFSLNSV